MLTLTLTRAPHVKTEADGSKTHLLGGVELKLGMSPPPQPTKPKG
jgi:hypothetical protein